MTDFNPRLHGLRALAALGVLVFHWAQFFPIHQELHAKTQLFGVLWHGSLFIGFGWLGVPLFFVLSGYLLTHQWHGRTINAASLTHFWRRRFLRIYPAVWVQLLLLVVFASYLPGLPDIGSWTRVLANALLYLHLPPAFFKPINGVWWTLPVEFGFYLLLPALIAVQRRSSWVWVLAVAALVTLGWRWSLVVQAGTDNLASRQVFLDALPGSLVYFCAGFALAFLPVFTPRMPRYLALAGVLVAFYLVLVFLAFRLDSYWAGSWLLIVMPLVAATLIAALVWLLLAPLPGTGVLASRPLVWLGEISFGLYLWHYPVLMVQKAFWPQAWQGLGYSVLGLLITFLLTCCLAEISFRWVENPLMRWRRAPASRE